MPDKVATNAPHGGKHVAKRAASPVNPYDYSDTVKSPQWNIRVVPTAQSHVSDEHEEEREMIA
jgi:hypothetical protein